VTEYFICIDSEDTCTMYMDNKITAIEVFY